MLQLSKNPITGILSLPLCLLYNVCHLCYSPCIKLKVKAHLKAFFIKFIKISIQWLPKMLFLWNSQMFLLLTLWCQIINKFCRWLIRFRDRQNNIRIRKKKKQSGRMNYRFNTLALICQQIKKSDEIKRKCSFVQIVLIL